MADPFTAAEIAEYTGQPPLIHTANAYRITATIEALIGEREKLQRKVDRRGEAVNRALDKYTEMRAARGAAVAMLRKYASLSQHAPGCASETCRLCQRDSDAYLAGDYSIPPKHTPDYPACDCGVPALLARLAEDDG